MSIYGLLVGLGVASVYLVARWVVVRLRLSEQQFDWSMLSGLGCGLVTARLWHVMTDWSYYAANLGQIGQLAEGGLSIVGLLLGGGVGIMLTVAAQHWLVERRQLTHAGSSSTNWWLSGLRLLDAVALGLPLGQAIGRWGNYVNQELYGLPTNGNWGVWIDLDKRLPEFVNFSHYHPLFLYESVALLILLGGFWWWFGRHNLERLRITKPGMVFVGYLTFYAWWRFGLDYWRIDWRPLGISGLGALLAFNQVIWLMTGLIGLMRLWRAKLARSLQVAAVVVALGGLGLAGWRFSPVVQQLTPITQVMNDRLAQLRLTPANPLESRPSALWVAVARTPQELELGLSGRNRLPGDGMLFILPQRQQAVFWMKQMRFGLDLVWIRDGAVLAVTRDVPPPSPNTDLSDLPKYSPPQPVDWVLEVAAGRADQLGLTPGARLTLIQDE